MVSERLVNGQRIRWYENIAIYLNQIEFGLINCKFSIITIKLGSFHKNVTICFNPIEFGPINDDFPHITLQLVILYENITLFYLHYIYIVS